MEPTLRLLLLLGPASASESLELELELLILSDTRPFTFATLGATGERSLFLALDLGDPEPFLLPPDLERDFLLLDLLELRIGLFEMGLLLLIGDLIRLLMGERFRDRDLERLPERFLDLERRLERDLDRFLDLDLFFFDLDLLLLLLFLERDRDRLRDLDRFLDRDLDPELDLDLDLDLDFFFFSFSLTSVLAASSCPASVSGLVSDSSLGVSGLVLSMTLLWSAETSLLWYSSGLRDLLTSTISVSSPRVIARISSAGKRESSTLSKAISIGLFSCEAPLTLPVMGQIFLSGVSSFFFLLLDLLLLLLRDLLLLPPLLPLLLLLLPLPRLLLRLLLPLPLFPLLLLLLLLLAGLLRAYMASSSSGMILA